MNCDMPTSELSDLREAVQAQEDREEQRAAAAGNRALEAIEFELTQAKRNVRNLRHEISYVKTMRHCITKALAVFTKCYYGYRRSAAANARRSFNRQLTELSGDSGDLIFSHSERTLRTSGGTEESIVSVAALFANSINLDGLREAMDMWHSSSGICVRRSSGLSITNPRCVVGSTPAPVQQSSIGRFAAALPLAEDGGM